MEDLSRRTVLRGAVVVGVAVPTLSLLDLDPASATTTRLTRSTFTPRVGSTFQVRGPWGDSTVTLASIADLPNAAKGDEQRFSLNFQQRTGLPIAQGTWQFRHPQLGRFLLFVVPAGQAHGRYEAIFNAR